MLLLQQQSNRGLILEKGRELNINRSGSAPPTVEGALCTAGILFKNPNFMPIDISRSSSASSGNNGVLTEGDIRSLPAYPEYYYSHENFNPRLPPPLLSKEDWRVAQRVRAAGSGFGGVGDWRNKNLVDDGGKSSLFSVQPGLSVQEVENELMELRKAALRNLSQKNHKASTDTTNKGMGVRSKSFADIQVKEFRRHTSGFFSFLFIFTASFTSLCCTYKILWNSNFCNYCWFFLLLFLVHSVKPLTK